MNVYMICYCFSLLCSFLEDFYSEQPVGTKFPTAVKAAGVMLPCVRVTLLAGWMLIGGATLLQEECASSFTRS